MQYSKFKILEMSDALTLVEYKVGIFKRTRKAYLRKYTSFWKDATTGQLLDADTSIYLDSQLFLAKTIKNHELL